VEPLQMPRAGEPVVVHERQPAPADDLAVVPLDRLPPPHFRDAPAVADLDRLALTIPGDRHQPAVAIDLDADLRMLAEQPGHPATSGLTPASSSAAPRAAPRCRRGRLA